MVDDMQFGGGGDDLIPLAPLEEAKAPAPQAVAADVDVDIDAAAAAPDRGRLADLLLGWGISVGLHVAILACFVLITWRLGAKPPPPEQSVGVIVPNRSERIDAGAAGPVNMDTAVNELAVPQLKETVRPEPIWEMGGTSTASKVERLISIDVGAGGDVSAAMKGDWTQLAEGSGVGSGGASFFGLQAAGGKFVFVVDYSGSMKKDARLDAAKAELVRAIRALDRKMTFYIIFFDHMHKPMPAASLTRATEVNKRRYLGWVSAIRAGGGTDPTAAMTQALSLKPHAIWLLSDGNFDPAIAKAIGRLNPGRKVQIHTIAFFSRAGEPVLREIADQNRGRFRFVTPASLGQTNTSRRP